MCSKEILKQELSPHKPLINGLDSISGNLNKVYNQIVTCLDAHDNEVQLYKEIITNKLKPQLSKLMNDNNMLT